MASTCACQNRVCSFPGRVARQKFRIGQLLVSREALAVVLGTNLVLVYTWPRVQKTRLTEYLKTLNDYEVWEPHLSLAGLCQFVREGKRLTGRWYWIRGHKRFFDALMAPVGNPVLTRRKHFSDLKSSGSPGLIP